MATVVRTLHAPPQHVWDVLSDGWLYPSWVVGASRMREVDDRWPATGAKLHHSVGVWPLLLDDETEVLDADPLQHLRLEARGRPGGEAVVDLRLTAEGAGTRVQMSEDLSSGPGRLVPKALRDPAIAWRNTESLRRLAYIAERRPVDGP